MEQIWERKVLFLGTFFVVFTLSYIVLIAIDFIPEPVAEETATTEVDDTATESSIVTASSTVEEDNDGFSIVGQAEAATTPTALLPVEISIEKLGKIVSVKNPTSRTIADLDAALLEGAVRHPDSADFGQEGNMFILAHSSYLPDVFNKNFQAFNGIQNLEWGDTIEVTSDDAVYEYRVEKVYRASAQDLTVPIADTGNMLTLATCNSFGQVDDRYIVEAKQVGSQQL